MAGMHEVVVTNRTTDAIKQALEQNCSLWRVSSTVRGEIRLNYFFYLGQFFNFNCRSCTCLKVDLLKVILTWIHFLFYLAICTHSIRCSAKTFRAFFRQFSCKQVSSHLCR